MTQEKAIAIKTMFALMCFFSGFGILLYIDWRIALGMFLVIFYYRLEDNLR